MLKTRLHGWGLALLAGTLMSACGGGGDDASPPLTEVPDTALASPTAFTQFARGLPASDGDEPLSLGRIDMAPASETDEPASLD